VAREIQDDDVLLAQFDIGDPAADLLADVVGAPVVADPLQNGFVAEAGEQVPDGENIFSDPGQLLLSGQVLVPGNTDGKEGTTAGSARQGGNLSVFFRGFYALVEGPKKRARRCLIHYARGGSGAPPLWKSANTHIGLTHHVGAHGGTLPGRSPFDH
jgi:hypothetical protein